MTDAKPGLVSVALALEKAFRGAPSDRLRSIARRLGWRLVKPEESWRGSWRTVRPGGRRKTVAVSCMS